LRKPILAALALIAVAPPAQATAPVDPSRLAAISPPPFARAPMTLSFRDQHGRTVSLGALAAGKPLLLVPVQHACRNLCGYTLEALRAALAGQAFKPGVDVTVVAFGIDPRETAADAARSAERLGGVDTPGVEAVVGDHASDAALTRALGYRYSWMPVSGQYAHLAAVAVLARDGRLVRWLPGLGVKPSQLQVALWEARRGEAPGFVDQIRLLCFHFDPTSGRYTLAVWRLLQGLAAAAVIAGAAAIALALRRERRRPAA
jgi:protein SCO1/2